MPDRREIQATFSDVTSNQFPELKRKIEALGGIITANTPTTPWAEENKIDYWTNEALDYMERLADVTVFTTRGSNKIAYQRLHEAVSQHHGWKNNKNLNCQMVNSLKVLSWEYLQIL